MLHKKQSLLLCGAVCKGRYVIQSKERFIQKTSPVCLQKFFDHPSCSFGCIIIKSITGAIVPTID